MSAATMIACNPAAGRIGWRETLHDIRCGALATARMVVTFSGCAALAVAALVFGNDALRSRVLDAVPVSLVLGSPAVAAVSEAAAVTDDSVPPAVVEPQQERVAQYLARRYRVADEAVRMLVSAAFETGREKKVDPLLILSVMAIESSLNPFAASPMGAQGLMQVMTRVHSDRFDPHGGQAAALDPVANIKVGSAILSELIARGGSIERGLHLYVGAGANDDDGGYGARVLTERLRLQLAAAGKPEAVINAVRTPAPEVRPAATVAPASPPAVPVPTALGVADPTATATRPIPPT